MKNIDATIEITEVAENWVGVDAIGAAGEKVLCTPQVYYKGVCVNTGKKYHTNQSFPDLDEWMKPGNLKPFPKVPHLWKVGDLVRNGIIVGKKEAS